MEFRGILDVTRDEEARECSPARGGLEAIRVLDVVKDSATPRVIQ